MLEGTDLYSAYAPLNPTAAQQPGMDDNASNSQQPIQQNQHQQEYHQEIPTMKHSDNNMSLPSSSFHEQYEKEQKLLAIINELKRRQASGTGSSNINSISYWDKLMNKKKDIVKFLQSALIIVFALSVHFLISHYFHQYLSSNDVSFERELILRLLYPIGIVFVAWNIMLTFK